MKKYYELKLVFLCLKLGKIKHAKILTLTYFSYIKLEN